MGSERKTGIGRRSFEVVGARLPEQVLVFSGVEAPMRK